MTREMQMAKGSSKAAPVTAEDHRALLAVDYGQFEAAYAIVSDLGAPIYGAGHPVPASNVDDEGRVALSRHTCIGHERERCEQFNEVEVWSEPGAAVRRATPRQAAEAAGAKPARAGRGGAGRPADDETSTAGGDTETSAGDVPPQQGGE